MYYVQIKADIPDKLVLLCGKEQVLQPDQEQDQFAEVMTEQKQQSFPSQTLLGKWHPCLKLLEGCIRVALMKKQTKL